MDQHIAKNTIHTEHLAKLCQYITPKILDSISEGIMITNLKSQIIDVNPAFEFVTGYKKEEVIGKKPDVLQSGNHKKDFYQKMWASIASEGEWQGEIWNRRKTGDVYPEWLKITKITNDEDTIIGYCGIFSDLSDEKNVESELKKRATTDMLTGVSNRFAFTERMNVLLSTSKTHNYQHAVLFLDLDRFKQVNDTLGHAIGDQLLVEVTRRIKTLLKNKDIFARYGGDEFVLTFTDIHHPREALHLGEKIIQLLESPFYIHTHELFITASIGISVYPHDGDDTETLLNKADIAMYYAKDHGKNQFSFYFDDLKTDAKRTFTLDSELRKAISNKNEFEIYYQPKVNYQKQQIIGMEALVRWHNEILGNVSPGEFIPYAEETGLIIPLSEIILEKVCLDAHELIGYGYKMPIAINISSIHFHQPNFITSIQQILERNNLPANHFELELTERTIMNNEKETTRKLILLKHMGFKLSLDDFGTGYSSLSYLVEFPLDCLKIDQSFIKQICSVSDKQAIVHAIIQMAHRLQMSVIAEGVEQRDQVKLLGEMDCDMIQGYYYSKPVPLDEIMEFLEFWELEIEGK
ncbi:EAL domain-containing protein [Rummeliibacillus stabekisii]|uniref:EAL domain-containing protein n=1 Tax=Rummeliibacillus stabekisii TaxID=241244 RepID=UPI0011746131|nr:EAL domain-containing protein [Rummeliibacillus stabekisii]MBB5168908.1 diguanylate cyclase (GGDEF)-like protein/PAS domain S-box-containing protein [Rummeliibacillus stabekisii]GEL04947.1 hypothetical protein RST01_15740 [Rummeliibacillus stabekisii]